MHSQIVVEVEVVVVVVVVVVVERLLLFVLG